MSILTIHYENQKFIATNAQNQVVARAADINDLLDRLIKKSTAKIKQQGDFKVQLQNITGVIIYYCNRGILINNQEKLQVQKQNEFDIDKQLKNLQSFTNSYCYHQTENAHVRSHSIRVTNYTTDYHSEETKRIAALKDAFETLENPQFFRNYIHAYEREQKTLKELNQSYTKQKQEQKQEQKYNYSSNPYDLGDKYNAIAESNRLRRERDENEKIMDEVKRGLRY